MKLYEVLDPTAEQLDEGIIKQAIAAAAMVVGALSPSSNTSNDPVQPPSPIAQVQQHKGANPRLTAQQMISIASQKYKVSPKIVRQAVKAAIKYQDPVFPRAEHILAVVGVESGFNPKAKSQLASDPAIGLTQIRPEASGIGAAQLATIDGQIKHGASMLKQYYKRFGSIDAALHAYNVGPGNHLKSQENPKKGNPRYAPKVNAELQRYL
jgi:soluble lytic murein transglycosylase-like protein